MQQSQKLDFDVLFIGEHEKLLFFNLPSVRSQPHLEEEGNAILANISSDEYVITLEILGTMLESPELASKISKLLTYGNTNITFVIGGSYGLSDSVKQRSNFALSFSKMTFPHQLMRVILIEQIYRSFTIINNKEYHK